LRKKEKLFKEKMHEYITKEVKMAKRKAKKKRGR